MKQNFNILSCLLTALMVLGLMVTTIGCKEEKKEKPVMLQGVKLQPGSIGMTEGTSNILELHMLPSGYVSPEKPSFSSSAPQVLTVDELGQIRAVSVGTATITATLEGYSATCAVEVFAKPVVPNPEPKPEPDPSVATSISLTPQMMSVDVGFVCMFAVSVLPETADKSALEWSSSNTDVATIDAYGTITPISAGRTKITAKLGALNAYASLSVNAKK